MKNLFCESQSGDVSLSTGLYEKLTRDVSDIKVDVAPSEIRTSRGKELAVAQKISMKSRILPTDEATLREVGKRLARHKEGR